MKPEKLSTARFTLKPYLKKHEDRWVEMAMDPVSTKFMGGSTGDEEEERTMFRRIFELYKKQDSRVFWIWGVYEGANLLGHLELKETSFTEPDELEVVIMVHPDARGNSVMTEVLEFLKANQSRWERRIIATVDKDNIASLRAFARWGVSAKKLIAEEDGSSFYKLILSR